MASKRQVRVQDLCFSILGSTVVVLALAWVFLSPGVAISADELPEKIPVKKAYDKIEVKGEAAPQSSNPPQANELSTKKDAQTGASSDKSKVMPASLNVVGIQTPAKVGKNGIKQHRLQMRISGSTCLSCLMELEKKLKANAGVIGVKIEPPGPNFYRYYGAPATPFSEATIFYDADQVSAQTLASFVKQQGYQPFRLIDKMHN